MNHKYLKNILLICTTTGLMTQFIMKLMHCRWCCIPCFHGAESSTGAKSHSHTESHITFTAQKSLQIALIGTHSHFSHHYYNEAPYVPNDGVGNLCKGKMGQAMNYFYCLILILMWTINSKQNSFHCYIKKTQSYATHT